MNGSDDLGLDKVLREVKDLVRALEGSGVAKLSIEKGDVRIALERAPGRAVVSAMPAVGLEEGALEAASSDGDRYHQVLSPLVGIFYRSGQPGAKSFVDVGDLIDPGTVIGIVEAMKVMNEIRSEVGGLVTKILVENGQPVQYEQPLVIVERSGEAATAPE